MNGIIMDLETPLDPATFDPTQRRPVMERMISVVLALHQKGIIHGDLKPANMLICSDGRICLCDFAEARGVSEDPQCWEGMTTANYLSPIRTQHYPGYGAYPPPTIEDDLYGLGLSIWELYTGKMPFKDVYIDDIISVLQQGGTVDVNEVGDKDVRAVICTYLRYGGARV
jgi:serine/threonine protein kinase